MNNDNNITRIDLTLDTFSKTENLFFSSLSYFLDKKNIYNGTINLFGYDDDINNIVGKFIIDTTNFIGPIGTSLVEFLNFNFDNFKDFFIYFTKYFDKYYNETDSEALLNLECDIDEDSTKILPVAQKVYKTEKSKLKKTQKSFRKAVEFIYNLNDNKDLNSLTFKQRFYVFQCIDNTFVKFVIGLNYEHDFTFKYPNEFYTDLKHDEKSIIKRIKEFDPRGNKIIVNNYYESSNIFAIFYIILYHLTFITDTYIRKCKNCNKYFLTSKSNTVYCENIFSNNQTCREIGKQLTQKKKQEDETVYGKYRKLYARKAMLLKRNPDIYSREDYDNWKKNAQVFLKDIKENKKTYEEFNKWLDKNN